MRLDQNPLFRRVIAPWYDSASACWSTVISMALVAFFSIVGLSVALGNPAYRGYAWYPSLILVLSLYVIASVAVRVMRRRFGRGGGFSDRETC